MAYICYNKSEESEFDNIVSRRDFLNINDVTENNN